jgi:hypothetical protein
LKKKKTTTAARLMTMTMRKIAVQEKLLKSLRGNMKLKLMRRRTFCVRHTAPASID